MARSQLSTNFLKKLRRREAQHRAVTGRPLPPDQVKAIVEGALAIESEQAIKSEALGIDRERIELAKRAEKREAATAAVIGVGELAIGGKLAFDFFKGKEAVGGGLTELGKAGSVEALSNIPAPTAAGITSTIAPAISATTAEAAPAVLPQFGPPIAEAGAVEAGAVGAGALTTVAAPAAVGFGIGKAAEAIFGEETVAARTVGTAGAAAAGFAIANVPGAIIGAALGWASQDCILVTACEGRDSEEVEISRQYRDKFMSPEAIRGYYIVAESIVPRMEANEEYKKKVKTELVDKLVEYGRFKLGNGNEMLTSESSIVANNFLEMCESVGNMFKEFTRVNGEVV